MPETGDCPTPVLGKMLIDAALNGSISRTTGAARAHEHAGYDGLWIAETQHEPFLQVLDAVRGTDRATVGTSVAIAFARSPMTLASTAFDLARHSDGRFVLGLGSQVRQHIERRYSMPWSKPAARMRELVLAMRSIWDSWQEGTSLDFEGEFYTHTLMTPFFAPRPHEWGAPPVYLAGVGPRMTEVAGEVCDGFFFHPFTTDRYLREITLPALDVGKARRPGRLNEAFTVAGPGFVCTGSSEEEMAAAIRGTKDRLAFYASTPAYRPVLDLHGWSDLQSDLAILARDQRWAEMGHQITDEVLHAFAVVAEPAELATSIQARWGDIVDRLTVYTAYRTDPLRWPSLLRQSHPAA